MNTDLLGSRHPTDSLWGQNPVELKVGAEATFPVLWSKLVTEFHHRPMLHWEGRTWSYTEVDLEVSRFAAWLQATAKTGDGLRPRVVSFLPNHSRTVFTWLGTMLAGGIYIPLNYAHRGSILTDLLARSSATILVTDHAGAELLPDLDGTSVRTVVLVDEPGDHIGQDGVRWLEWASTDAKRAPAFPSVRFADVAEVMFTSGTTGRSKAVSITHQQLCRGAGWVARSMDLRADDVTHVWMPLFHVGGQLDLALATWVAGGSVALFPRLSLSRLRTQVAQVGATVIGGFALVADYLRTEPSDPELDKWPVRAALIAGMSADHVHAFEQRFGLTVFDIYGMTEVEPIALPMPDVRTPPGSCGTANPDLEVGVVDDKGGPVGPGVLGEIVCRSRVPATIMAGYDGDPHATSAAFDNGWFRTGDYGRIDEDGFIYFSHRTKDAIRRHGENIPAAELESAILQHPAVSECCVVGVPSPSGEHDVKAVVATTPGHVLQGPDLHAWCQAQVARFMVPRYIEVVDSLPRDPLGKLLRRKLTNVRNPGVWDAERASAGAGTT